MSYEDNLKHLAQAFGIATDYLAITGETVEATGDTLLQLLRAMGVDLPTDPTEADLAQALESKHLTSASRPLPASIVGVEGTEIGFVAHVHDGAEAKVRIELEDGSTREVYQDENWTPPTEVDSVMWGEASFHVPGNLPRGYHRVVLESEGVEASAHLIITPARLSTTDRFLNDRRFGVMAQLYSVRSEGSWGIGDFHDLGELAATLHREIGADFLLINPLHAAEPFPPIEDSPYLPTSRRFVNPLYLRVEDTAEFAALPEATRTAIAALSEEFKARNRDPEKIDRNPIYSAKLDVLRDIFADGLPAHRDEQLDAYLDSHGESLTAFARWCAQQEIDHLWSNTRHASPPSLDELTRFYVWLQFLCDEQLAAAQATALDAGMEIGVITDLAVGVHPCGADAATMAELLVHDASVGAPPDPYNELGQDWSQPPWNPHALAEVGYRPWRKMIADALHHSGGIRVDHVLGLFRLFWMPRFEPPSSGTYVYYDFEAMVGILALEAERAGAIVIGEDLGTFEPWVQDVLASRGILGTSVLWFESSPDGSGPRRPHEYRRQALSAVGTHDLPPTAGYLDGEHIRLRTELGLLHRSAEAEFDEDLRHQNAVFARIQQAGLFDGDLAEADFSTAQRETRGELGDLLVGLHRYIAATPSALTVTNLVDLVGDVRIQNQPGTNGEQYANWRIPLCDTEGNPVLIEDLPGCSLLHRVGEASKR
ncbi:4-alpha-glucanotransferase [Corynebacterium uterequi]|uniref:4-alpha-glucanotransferase n=1 Tax=Corynebacterium uterequi TaxID=1072256 RepID=A0A0G3HI43_9CORY|nr:4-alpha-glucanotransferase [Corynebacterium uterequi]AKK11588.1 4-alpha-glucanotransferase [Corynebacterium uterequi]